MSSIHSLLQARHPHTTPTLTRSTPHTSLPQPPRSPPISHSSSKPSSSSSSPPPQHQPSPHLPSPHPDLCPRERALRCAITALQSGTFPSERRCASAFNIPRSTLRDRLSGRVVARSEAHADRQRLSPQQETLLCYWVLQAGWFGVAPTRERVREMAGRLLESEGGGRGGEGWSVGRPLGKVWVKGFLRRNPRVAGVVV